MNDLIRLLRYARQHLTSLVLGILLTSVVGIFETARIALVEPIINGLADNNSNNGNGTQVVQQVAQTAHSLNQHHNLFTFLHLPVDPAQHWLAIAGLMMLFTILKGIAFFASGYLLTRVGQHIIVQLRQRLFDHFLRQSAGFFHNHRTTDLATHIISDVERVQQAVTVLIADTLRESFTLLTLLCYAFYVNWQLAAFSLVIVPIIYGLTVRFGKRLRRTSHHTQEGIQEVLGIAQETIGGNRVVKAFGTEAHESQRFHQALLRLFHTNMRTAVALYLSSPIMELVGFLLLSCFLIFAHQLIARGTLTLASFTALLATLFKLYDPMRKLSQTQNTYQQIFAASSRIFTLLDEHTELVDSPNAVAMPCFAQQIEFRQVNFRYDKATRPALNNIKLKINKGEVIALVGLSGAGKSTLTNLLPRFFDPTEGAILIDGVNIRDLKLASLRSQLAIVSQEVLLFHDTIQNNIAYGRTDVTAAQIEAAARAAYAHDFIMERGGYQTIVGENGATLSAGQRQRITIARALLKDAPILILDEATSSLDTEAETQIQQSAFTNLMANRTTIMIAHRLSTVRDASRIVVLDEGKIAEIGTHEELLATRGIYQKLYELQFASDELETASPMAARK